MASYITLTTTHRPDPIAVVAAIKTATGDATAVLIFDGSAWRGKKATAWTAPQIADAQTILDTTPALTKQVEAQREIDEWPIMFRALVLTLIDELNILRNLHGLAPRTPAQAITAIRNKAGTLNGS